MKFPRKNQKNKERESRVIRFFDAIERIGENKKKLTVGDIAIPLVGKYADAEVRIIGENDDEFLLTPIIISNTNNNFIGVDSGVDEHGIISVADKNSGIWVEKAKVYHIDDYETILKEITLEEFNPDFKNPH